jgi:hypothetical protein
VLIGNDFVFLHVPKTGGSFVQQVILDHLPTVDVRGYTHTPFRELPAHAQALPGFYVVRNPWDWYVSWFHYSQQWGDGKHEPRRQHKAIIWNDLLRRGEASFAEAVTRALTGDFDRAALFPSLDEPSDLYTAYVRDIVGPALERPDFTAIRFEHLRRGLRSSLLGRGGVDKALLRAVRDAPPERTSVHRLYVEYYDRGLRDLVGQRTGWLCERYHYRFTMKRARERDRSSANARS